MFKVCGVKQEFSTIQPYTRLIDCLDAPMDELMQVLTEGKQPRRLGSMDPRYLIQFPYVWLEHYPWQPGDSRIYDPSLNSEQMQQIETKLPDCLPNARAINFSQFLQLVESLYAQSQKDLPQEQRLPLSQAIAEAIEHRLISSETVMRIDSPWGTTYYALTRMSYSPVEREERTDTVVEDTSRFFQLMKDWADRKPITMRLLEELDILPDQMEPAMQELDEIVRAWADKYHHYQGQPVILQAVFGPKRE